MPAQSLQPFSLQSGQEFCTMHPLFVDTACLHTVICLNYRSKEKFGRENFRGENFFSQIGAEICLVQVLAQRGPFLAPRVSS